MTRRLRGIVWAALPIGLVLAAGPATSEAAPVTSTSDQIGVVDLSNSDMDSIVGGQESGTVGATKPTAEGYVATTALEQFLEYLNAGEASTWGAVVGGSSVAIGMLIAADDIQDAIDADVTAPLASDIHDWLVNSGYNDSDGNIQGVNISISSGSWANSWDTAVFTSSATANVGDYYCGGQDCMCGDEQPDYPCNTNYACNDGYCDEGPPPPM